MFILIGNLDLFQILEVMIFKKLKEIFDQLPEMVIGGKNFKPQFHFGTQEQLVAYLSLKRKSGEKYYPLIYLQTPFEESDTMEFTFILATLNKNVSMTNWERLDITFGTTLEPLLDNLIVAIKQSGIFYMTDEFSKENRGSKYFNYHVTPDIWDAIEYKINVRYRSDCKIKTIYF